VSADHVERADQPQLEIRVTLQDLRAARYCLGGARLFCRQHGLDWAGFLVGGVSAERLRATGDALVEPVIAAASARVAAERAQQITSPPPSGPSPDGQ
jgi:hypothetical protein